MASNPPINVKPVEGERGKTERGGIGQEFDIFQKVAVKFPTPRQKCEVKYNWNSPPWEMICGQMFANYSSIPTPGTAKAINQIPALCPASFPAGLTLIALGSTDDWEFMRSA